jgi:hypothetical protein
MTDTAGFALKPYLWLIRYTAIRLAEKGIFASKFSRINRYDRAWKQIFRVCDSRGLVTVSYRLFFFSARPHAHAHARARA